MRRFLYVIILVLSFGLVALPAGATTPATVSPPATITANCTKDVANGMQRWLASLPANTTVVAPAGACYLINGGITVFAAQGLTIAGGTWEDETAPVPGAPSDDMNPALWFRGGSNVTLENLTVDGSSPGGYTVAGAFGAGIRSDGVIGFRVTDVNVDNVWGDGLELTPLRGSNDTSGVIVNPTENVSVYGLNVNGAGRQGVTLASVAGATLTDVHLQHIGFDFFDVEADQGNEGAVNVTINDCETGGAGGLFFANMGASAGAAFTRNITVENCTMDAPTAGEAVLVQAPTMEVNPRGPITFLNDTLRCGSSVYVSCIQATDADIVVANSTVLVPGGTVHEPVFNANESSGLDFSGDSVSGYGAPGSKDTTSNVSITGGQWSPYSPPHPSPGPGPVHGAPPFNTPSGTSAGNAPSSTTTSTIAATTTSTGPTRLHGVVPVLSGKTTDSGNRKGTGSPAGGATTAAVLTSDSNDPLTSPLLRSFLLLDLGAGAVASGLLLVRRRRHLGVVPATHSVQDLLGRPRRSESA